MTNKTPESFFTRTDDDLFVGNGPARGPWTTDACHAGPVSGLLARAAENTIANKQMVRLTANFVRPVPMHGFRVETEVIRDGRTAALVSITLKDQASRICATATSSHIVTMDVGALPTHELRAPQRAGSTPGMFALREAPHGLPFFSQSIEMEYPPGEDHGPGPTTAWMRTPPLLPDETPSPFQSICPLSDCGNGISRNLELNELSFVNPDITIALHRLPESEWLASSAVSHWQSNGIGLAHATLFDELGAVGVALQSLVLRPL
jgi:acyl-CoA thioesterase